MINGRLLTLFPLLAAMACVPAPSTDEADPMVENDSIETVAAPEPERLTLLFAGDLMQHQAQFEAARRADGTYDYTGCFDAVRPLIEQADVAIANLETTFGGAPYRGYPCFCSPDAYGEAIREAGFDVLTTCNNHSCDTRLRGIRRTLEVLDTLRVPHLGTYADSLAREAQYPYMLEAKGFRIALLAYTYGTNGIPVPKPAIVNKIDTVQMAKDILKAQQMQPDAIIAMMHWGYEHHLKPNQEQRMLADWLIAHGVNHVIGGHPHVIQPTEMREDTVTGERHLVVWSLGNYVSHMLKTNCDGGLMVNLTLERDAAGQCHAVDYGHQLIWVDRPGRSGKRVHRVLPIDYPDSLLTAASRAQRDVFVKNMTVAPTAPLKGITVR